MGGSLKQDTRFGELTTPLEKDDLVLVRFDATERLSELFEFRVECLSEKPDLNFDNAIGKQCKVRIKMLGLEREFSGILVEAKWTGVLQDLHTYRLILRPWLWLLSRTTDCRIFQDMKAPDIIKEVFDDRKFRDYDLELHEDCPKLEYCVQYRETDLNFVSRLMEQHGIYYFFKHEGGKHTLVLAEFQVVAYSCAGSCLDPVPYERPARTSELSSTSPTGSVNAALELARSSLTTTITKSPAHRC